jgi:hypothetical protein
MFTRGHHRSLIRDRLIQSTPSNRISLRSILILPTHLRLGLRVVSSLALLCSQRPTIRPCHSILILSCYLCLHALRCSEKIKVFMIFIPVRATFPAHLILLNLLTILICNFLNPPLTSSFSGPSILHNTVFSNTLNFHARRSAHI